MEIITKKRALAWGTTAILGPLAIGWIASALYIAFWFAATRHRGAPPPDVLARGMMLGTILGLWGTVCLVWLAERKRTACRELFATTTRTLPIDLLIGLALGLAWVAVYGLFDVVAFSDMFVADRAKLLSLPATFTAGFCEEFLFRGLLVLVIARAGGGPKAQVLWTSLAFGLAHVFWGPWGMLWTAILGGTFGLMRAWRGNVWPAVAAHTVLNLCIEPALIHKAMSGGFQ